VAKKLVIWSVKDVKECIEKMTSKEVKFDCVIFIEGNRGIGKSTLAYKLLTGLNIEIPFRPIRDIVYSRDDTLKHLANKINGCIFSDEMINVAYRRDHYVEDQKELLKAFDMYRDSRNVFVGCIPKFVDLDSKLQMLCKIRITVVRRGIALIQMKNKGIFTNDPWDVRANMKIESGWSASVTKNPRYAQLTTVRGLLRFGDLGEAQRIEYDKIKEAKRSHVFARYAQEDLAKDPEQLFLENMITMLREGKITLDKYKLVCEVNNKDPQKLQKLINKKLREDNDQKTWRDYCISEKQKRKKDKLGFVLGNSNTPITQPEQAQAIPLNTIQKSTTETDVFDFEA